MPPKRRSKQPRHHIEQSDYDSEAYHTDAAAQVLAAAVTHPARDNNELNLVVLQRHYPDVIQIVSHASFSVLYTFNPQNGTWEKSDMEGPLFVCELLPAQLPGTRPSSLIQRYKAIILNRKSLNNFNMDLVSPSQIEVNDEFVMFNVVDNEGETTAYGLWIFAGKGESTEHQKEINSQVIVNLATRAEESTQMAQQAAELEGNGQETEPDYADLDGRYYEGEQPHQPYEQQQQHQSYGQQQQQAPPMTGQQISMASLFGQPQAHGFPIPQQMDQHERSPQQYGGASANGHASYGQPAQSDVLLNLFRSAR